MVASLRCPTAFTTSTAFRSCKQRPTLRFLAISAASQRRAAINQHSGPQQACQEHSSTSSLQLASLAPFLPLWLANAALAEDLSLDDLDVDAAYAAEFSQTTGSTDLVVSVLAGAVFLLLTVVTAGVAYLTLKSWLDERQENNDREGEGKKPATGFTDVGRDEPEVPKRVRVKREKRGFGN